MRKETIFILAVMAAASLQASDITQQNQVAEGRATAPSCLHKAANTPAPLRSPMSAAADWKFDVSADDIIYDQPSGELKMYSKACDYYTSTMFGAMMGSSEGMPCRVVEDENGGFYIYNPFAGIDTKTWLKGSVEGDRMTVKLPQAIYSDSDGSEEYVYVAQMCHFEWTDDSHESGLYYPEDGETEIIFNKEGDSWVMQQTEEINEHPMIMGLVAADDGTWCIYSDWNIRLTPFTEEVIQLPDDAKVEEWSMIYPIEGEYIAGNTVKIAFAGSDVYMSGISSSFPDSWIKGTWAEGKFTFPSGQYIGADEMSNTFGYFYGMSEERQYNEDWDYWYSVYSPLENLTFERDSTTGLYLTENSLTVVKGENGTTLLDLFTQPKISVTREVNNYTPLDPIVGYYSEYNGTSSLYFKFPVLNTEGQLLDSSNLYYRVYVDGELFEFYSDEYAGVEDGTVEIPFNFSNRNTIGCYGTGNITHFVTLAFSGFETLDIQTCYIEVDKKYESNIVNVIGGNVDVKEIECESSIVSEQWYDISGRIVLNPENGLYVRRVEYSDGTVRSFKTILR